MKSWADEGWRLGATLLVGLLAGVLLGKVLLGLAFSLLLYSGWMILRLYRLNTWLLNGAKTAETPDTSGLLNSVVQLVHREQRRTERQKEKLRHTLGQFNVLASEIPDATIVLDEKWLIQWCNSAADRLLGITHKADRGQRLDNLIRSPEFVAFLHEASIENREIEITSPVSHDLTLLVTCVPAGDDQLILTARNITQRVQVREMRKAFVADVSHELKTPLTVIQGHLEMLLENSRTDADDHLALARMREHSDRMDKIVSDLLTLSKLESSILDNDEGNWFSVHRIIERIVDDVSGSEHATDIHLDLDPTLQLFGMESEIHSCCQNLIQNAIAYNKPGTRIEIEWRHTRVGEPADDWSCSEPVQPNLETGTAIFVVRDFGTGINPEHLPKLSQRFYRVDRDRSRASGGTGLGLAIVKYIAQRHSGHLFIGSEIDRGSEFAVSFPPYRQRSSTEYNDPQRNGSAQDAAAAANGVQGNAASALRFPSTGGQ